LIDCSTIEVEKPLVGCGGRGRSRFDMLDAPVVGRRRRRRSRSPDLHGGGEEAVFAHARPVLEAMGRTMSMPDGGQRSGAKICNNMMLGISMIAVCEAFSLAERLGLTAQTLFDISSKSSGQCWALTSYCPVPGPVPASPANRGYAPGFTAAMMLKIFGWRSRRQGRVPRRPRSGPRLPASTSCLSTTGRVVSIFGNLSLSFASPRLKF